MQLLLTPEEQAFQQEVREFLRRELTDEIKRATAQTPSVFVEKDIALAWQRKLYRQGWLAPSWPAEYGGAQWSAIRRYIFDLEAMCAGAPSMIPMGLGMVAPVIMKFGTAQQKAEYLPKILSGEHYWCQGYSEPQSGSDLASLQCRAVRSGDHYVVTGTKIWTTHAHYATHIFCLVRTDTEVKAQRGISFLLIDMNTPGITVRPIHSFAGDHDVNQVFFDDVKVPVANRVGEEGQGWTCAKYLLEHERGGSFGSPLLLRDIANVKRLMDQVGAVSAPPELRRRLAELEFDTYSLQQYEIQVARAAADQIDPVAPSIIKTLFTETQQRITELAMDVAGPFAAILDQQRPLYGHAVSHDLPLVATVAPAYLNFWAASIYGGSNEIQRTVIARAVLGGPQFSRIAFCEEQRTFLDSAESFAARFYTAQRRLASAQSAQGFDAQCWEKFIELGWQYLGIPAEFDGLGGNYSDWMALAFGLGPGLLIEPLFTSLALPAVIFNHAVDGATARRGFERIAAGDYRYAIAHSEYGSRYGDDVRAVAIRDSGAGLILSGKKTLVEHAAAAHTLLVTARNPPASH
jgi:acyl-CoA dehydrogenase